MPAQIIVLRGQIVRGQGWVTENWSRMIAAHEDEIPDIRSYFPGTLNINLEDPNEWPPPGDDDYRRLAIQKSRLSHTEDARGRDFLRCGNYFHPQLRVISINDRPIEGRIYYPGSASPVDPGGGLSPIQRSRLEVCAKQRLRDLLGLPDDSSEVQVVVTIEVL